MSNDKPRLVKLHNEYEIERCEALKAKLHAAYARVARLESALDRHGAFRDAAVTLVRDMRLALLRGDYLIKQQMDARSDAWLKEVDGPRPTRSPSRPDNLSIDPSLSDMTNDRGEKR